ncbi:FAD:protein FMN transferase [Vibrio hangzhouensis]|uniref:FAD:protein FMN transferase n=1 Tax=Vibrio hangzhouensis TaxID=462991 RepID=A0A1H6B3Z0_9VIBR|nr:FAD:protein FMN transferase [Vibrio hangzhouensis]MBY6198892.1 FAD:protein FMN transferase [Vibrio hangzhouensis]SEG55548.1 thiamine biosynthesis lipoprotein [Vibrio hangzhouensis]
MFHLAQKAKFIILGFAAALVLTACGNNREQVHLSGPTMGTIYNVKYIVTDNTPKPETIQAEINRLLEEVNDQMSTYRQDSELSRFNRFYGTEPFPVSKETAIVVNEAIRLNEVTLGALDVTVGPLVNLWGFGPEARPEVVPTEEQLAERKAQTGIEHLSATEVTLKKDLRSLYVDLSTIAKGWGVDVLANYLENIGIQDYMVEVGGEMRLKGLNREGVKWRIAIEKPSADERNVQEIIEPGDMAIATSGDYRNYFEKDGIRYSHIIDPSTGKPIDNKVVSVTVLDKSSMTADGLATGLMVLGEEKALEVAEQYNIPAFIIVKTEDGFEELASEAFKPYLNK